MDETNALIDRVRVLLDSPVDGTPRARARIEYTLTEGYARALALEAERRRIDGRIAELTTAVDGDADRLSELSALARRRTRADGDLSTLRAALGTLRERLTAAAAAALTL